MKKLLIVFVVLFLFSGLIYAQNAGQSEWLPAVDAAIKGLALDLNRILVAERAANVAVNEFSYEETQPPLSQYISNQLIEELSALNGPYSVFRPAISTAAFFISGDIVDLVDAIRVFARVSRSSDRSVVSAFHIDFERNEQILQMLASGDSRRSSTVVRDAYEIDSMENPVPYEIGSDPGAPFINRTLHYQDEDFFLLVSEKNSALLIETTGNTDTYMELYDAVSREQLTQNDDGGSGTNARISYNVEAGKSYIAKVRGYGGDSTGSYGFHGYYREIVTLPPDEFESDNTFSTAKWITIGTPQQRSFHSGDDIDWVKFQVFQRGRYQIRARGVISNFLDIYVELYTDERDLIGEDDDGGEEFDSFLSIILDPGVYYLKVGCFDDEPDQFYLLSVDME